VTPELVELIKCPVCGGEGRFEVTAEETDAREILTGRIACLGCEAAYAIREGYCDLLRTPSAQVLAEQAAQRTIEAQARRDPTDKGLQPLGPNAGAPPEEDQPTATLPDSRREAEAHAPAVAYALERLALTGAETVLDLGAGSGWTTAQLARRGGRCVAVDVYANALAAARRLFDDEVHFDRLLGDMANVPIVSDTIDVVFANAAVHHSADLDCAVQEIARVLKGGGRCVLVNEPVIGLFETGREARFGLEERRLGLNERVYRITQWRRALRRAGLRSRFEITPAGLSAKIAQRRASPAYQGFPKRTLLRLLDSNPIRRVILAAGKPMLLWLYPFNVVIWAHKAPRRA